jgi:hypothetical protein
MSELIWTLVMHNYEQIFRAIQADERYQRNLDWGKPRKGHPEGTVRAHIRELEGNLHSLRGEVSQTDHWKLKLLIHTHDTFKADATAGVPIRDPRSHASLARAFLAEFCHDRDLLSIIQYHDEPYALWRHYQTRGVHAKRLAELLSEISDWDLFLTFLIIDGCATGKSREPLIWFFQEVEGRVKAAVTLDWLR